MQWQRQKIDQFLSCVYTYIFWLRFETGISHQFGYSDPFQLLGGRWKVEGSPANEARTVMTLNVQSRSCFLAGCNLCFRVDFNFIHCR